MYIHQRNPVLGYTVAAVSVNQLFLCSSSNMPCTSTLESQERLHSSPVFPSPRTRLSTFSPTHSPPAQWCHKPSANLH